MSRIGIWKIAAPASDSILIAAQLLTHLLDRGVAPSDLERQVSGKLFLKDESAVLSISHTGSQTLIAVKDRGALGLDLELNRPLPLHWQKIATRFFAPLLAEDVIASPRGELFLPMWTLFEAWIKARGATIAESRFDPAWVLKPDLAQIEDIKLEYLRQANGSHLAVAMDPSDQVEWPLRSFQFKP